MAARASVALIWRNACDRRANDLDVEQSEGAMSRELDLHLGRRIRRRRRLLGLTQSELGAICGAQFRQIQKYECAANRLSAVMLWSIATALDVDLSYFFEGLDGGRAEHGPAVLAEPRRSFEAGR